MQDAADITLNVPSAVWAGRITSEFSGSPGLRLTVSQASRFWGLDEQVCEALFASLVAQGVLTQTPAGAFMRPASR